MDISELILPGAIRMGVVVESREQVLDCLTELALSVGVVKDGAAFRAALENREEQGSTNFGRGLAVPHAQGPFTQKPAVLALLLKKGVPWGTENSEACDVFFCIAAPAETGEYMQTLACLMGTLRYPGLGDQLRSAGGEQEFRQRLIEAGRAADRSQTSGGRPSRILAVTACPTGIAHTYLAADALQKAALAQGIPIKVETNGGAGIQNQLTKEDIENCDAVIVAADKQVETLRFAGKRVIFAPVSAGVYHAPQLLSRAMAGEAPVYHPGQDLMAGEILPAGGRRHVFYRHLMNGVSHMLPFVVAGGILMTLGLFLDDYSLNPFNFGGNMPMPAFFTLMGKLAFSFMLPVTAGYIAHSIAGLPALAVGFVGGALAEGGIMFHDTLLVQGPSGGFLGALLAGFLAGYVVRGLQSLFRKLPQSLASLKPTILYPVLGVILVGAVICLLNPLLVQTNLFMGHMLQSLRGSSRMLLGAVLGGMMALDMGGPVNKTAYVFATAAVATGQLDVMAAVMAGGMVPPLAMGLCTALFPRLFPPTARRMGGLACVMGLCFITEGAVPFAVADPLRVVPSCVVSGAAAGALSVAFGCTLGAPQGGIFVLPLVNHPARYLVVLALASLLGAVMLRVVSAVWQRKDNKQK